MNTKFSHWFMFLLAIFTVKLPVFLLLIPQYMNNEYNIIYLGSRISLYSASIKMVSVHKHYNYSVEQNIGLFKIELRLYMSATCFGQFSGHRQPYQYKVNVQKKK